MIPLSTGRKARARDLLERTLRIVNGASSPTGFDSSESMKPSQNEETDGLGNLKTYQGIADNLIKVGDLSPIIDSKLKAQRDYVDNQRQQSEKMQSESALNLQEAQTLSTISSYEQDELGNYEGYNGTSDNLIQKGDLSTTADAKIAAQRKFMMTTTIPNNITSEILNRSEIVKNYIQNSYKNIKQGKGIEKNQSLEYDELGNIKGYQGLSDNLIQEGDLSPVRDAKIKKQMESLNALDNTSSLNAIDSSPSLADISAMPNESITMPQSLEYDELGTIKGYQGLSDNLIQEGDLSPVRDAKIAQQMADMRIPEFNGSDLPELPPAQEMPISNDNSTSSNEINVELGSIAPTFTIEGGDNPQAVIDAITSNLENISDMVAGQIADKVAAINANQVVMAS